MNKTQPRVTASKGRPAPPGNVRMNVNIPKEFYKRLKFKALEKDKTVKSIVLEALETYLKEE